VLTVCHEVQDCPLTFQSGLSNDAFVPLKQSNIKMQ